MGHAPNRNPLRALRAMRRRFRADSDGATAIEFGIVAIPFLALIFGILELALIFFTTSVLTQAVSDTGRLVRVGAFQGCGQVKEFKALVCDQMKDLMGCSENLRIDLLTASDFQSVTLVDPGMSNLDPDDDTKKINDGTYANTGPAEPVVLQATFYYPLALPNVMTRLESVPNSRRHVISTVTAFRNEPFPSSGSCGGDLSTRIAALTGNGGV
ncbi:MAG: TadE family protein [Pseudomonadota bacterium]